MAEKEERAATTGASRRSVGEAAEDKRPAGERAGQRVAGNGNGKTAEGIDASRRQQYLIALRQFGPVFAGTPSYSLDAIVDYLGRQEDVEITARVKSPDSQPFGADGDFAQEIVVARLGEAKAESLRAAAQPNIIVERDAPLGLADGLLPTRAGPYADAMLPFSAVAGELSLRVAGERDQPQPRAAVVAYGPGFPVQAVTDQSGTAQLSLFGGGNDSVRAIYVKPRANYWERLVVTPKLNDTGPTTIRLRPLAETFPNFTSDRPEERVVQWSQRLMRTDRPGNLSGAGVRVGVIDSGCDNTHPALRHVNHGRNLAGANLTGAAAGRRDDDGWTDDVLGHGTHAAGLIAAVPNEGQRMTGAAPGAEVHAFKVFPGGRLSDLLAALDECISRELDVVCIGVGCEEPSELLDQKLRQMRHNGIACVVAAGTSAARPLQFPAVQPGVLAVGAIGKLREFPPDTWHAQAVTPEWIGRDGLFPAAFSAVGPHVAVCAPGVAVLSSVPGGHAALDGTGVAAAQVTGLAALILAHHPLFQGPLKARSEQRVAALFGLIRACAVPHFADPLRGGAGVPDLQRVPGLYGAGAADAHPIATAMPSAYPDLYAAGLSASGMAPHGFEPFLTAQNWQTLMQMRAAGWI